MSIYTSRAHGTTRHYRDRQLTHSLKTSPTDLSARRSTANAHNGTTTTSHRLLGVQQRAGNGHPSGHHLSKRSIRTHTTPMRRPQAMPQARLRHYITLTRRSTSTAPRSTTTSAHMHATSLHGTIAGANHQLVRSRNDNNSHSTLDGRDKRSTGGWDRSLVHGGGGGEGLSRRRRALSRNTEVGWLGVGCTRSSRRDGRVR